MADPPSLISSSSLFVPPPAPNPPRFLRLGFVEDFDVVVGCSDGGG